MQGDTWRPLGRRMGTVSLGPHHGAVATVEATWVPLVHGALSMPTLALRDVPCQEIYSGSRDSVIVVAPA
jgi:hypothetical protein